MHKKKIIVLADSNKNIVARSINKIRPFLEEIVDIEGWYLKIEDINTKNLYDLDYLIVFGGDGLLLMTARNFTNFNIPVIGVNFGKLGFLAEFAFDEFLEQFKSILQGKYQLIKCMMLDCDIYRGKEKIYSNVALNEIVIKAGVVSRMLFVNLSINGDKLATFGGDGVIISTPVGSTAYSLSAGGPIISPIVPALIINPICPHALNIRPLVISAQHIVNITMASPYPDEVSTQSTPLG